MTFGASEDRARQLAAAYRRRQTSSGGLQSQASVGESTEPIYVSLSGPGAHESLSISAGPHPIEIITPPVPLPTRAEMNDEMARALAALPDYIPASAKQMVLLRHRQHMQRVPEPHTVPAPHGQTTFAPTPWAPTSTPTAPTAQAAPTPPHVGFPPSWFSQAPVPGTMLPNNHNRVVSAPAAPYGALSSHGPPLASYAEGQGQRNASHYYIPTPLPPTMAYEGAVSRPMGFPYSTQPSVLPEQGIPLPKPGDLLPAFSSTEEVNRPDRHSIFDPQIISRSASVPNVGAFISQNNQTQVGAIRGGGNMFSTSHNDSGQRGHRYNPGSHSLGHGSPGPSYNGNVPKRSRTSLFYSGGGSSGVSSSSKSSLNKVFDRYREDATGSPDTVGMENTMQYLGDIDVSVEGLDFLVVSEIIQTPTMGEMSREGFVNGWAAVNCDTIEKQKSHVKALKQSLPSDKDAFAKVYNFTFQIARTGNQKTLPLDHALAYWEVVFTSPLSAVKWTSPSSPWYEWWAEFLNAEWKRAINKDHWNQTLKFAQLTLEDESLSFWSEEASWPSIIDEFVEWVKKEKRGGGENGDVMEE